jgi:hypothetical protein
MRIVGLQCAAAILALSANAGAAAPAFAEPQGAVAQAIASARTEPLDDLVRDVERQHPVAMMLLAKRLFDAGRKDEAVFWFYEAQLRWRARLRQNPELGQGGGPLLGENEAERFQRLFHSLGSDINEYATGDIQGLIKTLDRVLEWDAAHPDAFAPPGPGKDWARQDCKDFQAYLVAHAEEAGKAGEARRSKALAAADDPYAGDGGAFMGAPEELVQPYDPGLFAAFKLGATSKAEVVRTLGRPEWWSTDPDGTSELAYSYNAPIAAGIVQRLQVSFKFDVKKVLTEIRLPRFKAG